MVHGDDFLALGDQKHLLELEKLLKGAYELKCLGIIGGEAEDKKELHFLNRLIRRKTSSVDRTRSQVCGSVHAELWNERRKRCRKSRRQEIS